MFVHIMVNQLRGQLIISRLLICFFSLHYDIISLTSLKITQAFHLLLVFAENQVVFRDFVIRNSIRITEGSDNGDSVNQGPTVLRNLFINHIHLIKHIFLTT